MNDQPAEKPRTIEASDLPPDMLTECPMRRQATIRATRCFTCEHFAGIGNTNPDERIPWEQRHVALCTFRRKLPIRRLEEV